ncbi:MAG: diguanylate cyclase [Beijerinckiaceae bacterium]
MTSEPDHIASHQRARRILDFMEAHGSPATPRAFEVWHHYMSGQNRSLIATMDAIMARRQPIGPREVDALLMGYIRNRQGEKKPGDAPAPEPAQAQPAPAEPAPAASRSEPPRDSDRQVIDPEKMIVEIDKACDLLARALGGSASYDQSLSQISSTLQGEMDRDLLRRTVASLKDATRTAIAENRALERTLRQRQDEIQSLRTALSSAVNESLTDPLTGVGNRKAFDKTLQGICKSAVTNNRIFSLLMVDIDHFKKFNDTFGHADGDKVLRLVASTIQGHVPPRGLAARYGGEEFAVIVPNHDLAQAKILADQIRETLRANELVKKSSGQSLGRVTTSIGVAQFRMDDTPETLIERADRCLYRAKREGRDRTIDTETEMMPAPLAKSA